MLTLLHIILYNYKKLQDNGGHRSIKSAEHGLRFSQKIKKIK